VVEAGKRVRIDREPEAVFDLITDPNRAHEWSGIVRSGSIEEEMGEGTTFRLNARFLGKNIEMDYEVIAYERPTRYAYTGDDPLKMTMTTDIEDAGGATDLTVTIDVDPGRVFSLAGPIFKRQVRKQLDEDLGRLKRLLEGG
jgi:carbon monoxide dehydrogenase subunit G